MKETIFVTLYVVSGFLTGGYYYNHRCEPSETCASVAIIAGSGWPAYWASRAAIEVTR